MIRITFFVFLTSLVFALTACGNNSGSKANQENTNGGIQWESIPSTYNPNEQKIEFNIALVQKIKMNLFGFDGDVRIQYSDRLDQSKMGLQIYSVSKDARTSLSGVDANSRGNTLNLNKYGSYECSIKTQNGQIVSLKGACYVRLVLTLPAGAEIEVENVGRLLTRRFFAIDNKTFLESLDRASMSEKFQIVENYLASYRAVGKNPILTSEELGKAIHSFAFGDEKLKALQMLHAYVQDRENLNKMIEREFGYFDREKARKIVGLN